MIERVAEWPLGGRENDIADGRAAVAEWLLDGREDARVAIR